MVVPLESSSAVLVMISSKSVSICSILTLTNTRSMQGIVHGLAIDVRFHGEHLDMMFTADLDFTE